MVYTNEEKYNAVLKHVASSIKEDDVQASITTDTLHRLIGMDINEEYVIKNKSYLTKEFGHLSSAYGFTDFHDFYLYAMSCDQPEPLQKRKKKDFSKLKQVTRTVTRNGKPTEMTFYEDPDKKDSNTQGQGEPGGEGNEEAIEPLEASELLVTAVGNHEEQATLKEIKEVKNFHSMIEGYQPFYADGEKYLILVHPEAQVPMSIIGFNYEEDYVILTFSDTSPLVKNYDVRVFYELIKEGLRSGKGVKTIHLGTDSFDILAEDHDMDEPEEGEQFYIQEYEELLEMYSYNNQ